MNFAIIKNKGANDISVVTKALGLIFTNKSNISPSITFILPNSTLNILDDIFGKGFTNKIKSKNRYKMEINKNIIECNIINTKTLKNRYYSENIIFAFCTKSRINSVLRQYIPKNLVVITHLEKDATGIEELLKNITKINKEQ